MIAPALSAFCILSKLAGIGVRFFAEGGLCFLLQDYGAQGSFGREI